MGEGFNKNSIPLLFVKGSHFEVGYKVGAEFKTRINTFISSHPYRESILQFYQDASGKEFCDKLLDNCRKLYPHYMDEIKGLAEGAGIPLHELELLHLNKEIQVHQASLEIGAGAVLRIFDSDGREENLADFEDRLQEWVDMGCTDILLNDGNEMIIGHNMDYYVSMGETMYVVCAHILPYTSMDGREFPEEKFVSHQYTGFLFGGNCCFSQHGLVYCVGALFPRDVTSHAAIPELFVRRHFLSATSPADAMSILQGSGAGVATGFAMHFTFLDQSSMWSAEVGPFQSEHVAENIAENVASELTILTVSPNCERPYVAHTNHYEHLRISHYVGQSSSARGVQLDALPPARDEQTVRHTLGNTDDDMLPIYRSSKISKQRKLTQCTVYTGIFNIKERKYRLYLDNPKDNDPILTLPLDMWT